MATQNVTEVINATTPIAGITTIEDTTSEVPSTTVIDTVSPTNGSDCIFGSHISDKGCIGIYAALGFAGLVVIAVLVICIWCICRKCRSRENGSVPKPPPPKTDVVHTDNQGNSYKMDNKGNRVYISDDSESDPEIPTPRPPAPDPGTKYNQGYEPEQDYPPRRPPPLPRSPERKTPPPPPMKRHVDDKDIFGNAQQPSSQQDHGLTYDDVTIEQDHGGVYDPVADSQDFGQSYIMPGAHQEPLDYGGDYEVTNQERDTIPVRVHKNPDSDWGGEYEDMSQGTNPYPPHPNQKPVDYGEDYEQPRQQPVNVFAAHSKQMGYKPRPSYPLPVEMEPYEETPMGQPMGKGVLDPTDIKLEEYIQEDVYQNDPVMNPKAKASGKYKNLHMTRGENVESEKPYVVRRK